MTGYSWISVTALFCYFFLFLTFLAARKTKKVIKTFMMLQVIMLLWSGGSFAMRSQFWPSVDFWHHVSLAGLFLMLPAYYAFILDFLEDKRTVSRHVWEVIFAAALALNYILAAYLIITGAALFVEALGMHKLSM